MENSNSKPLQEEQPRNDSGDKEKPELTEEKREFLMQLLNFRSTFVQSRKSADPKYKPYAE